MENRDPLLVVAALVELAEQIGLTVRQAPAPMSGDARPGGSTVRLRGEEIVFLDPQAGVADQVALLGATLKGRPELEEMYLRPYVREALDASDQQ
jgi:hypothetical protein